MGGAGAGSRARARAGESWQELCRLDEIPDGGARGFRLGGEPAPGRLALAVVAVRRGGDVRVYRNRCPHRGTPLDWVPDHFLDRAGRHLVCATHGAVFRVDDGLCLAGPCTGDRLEPLEARVEAGAVRARPVLPSDADG